MNSNRIEATKWARSKRRAPQRLLAAAVSLLGMAGAAGSASAVPSAPGYTVSFINTPGPAAGDVVVVGDALFVGSGAFGLGGQSLVRIDGSGTTTLATGFNSIGGMVYDSVNDRLFTGDNAGEQQGAVTGDTIYAIDTPFGSPSSAPAAASLELLPMGSFPGYSDVVLDPGDATGDTLFVGDASALFPPDGRLVEVAVASGSTSGLQSGLAFTAGLATDGSTLFFGEALLDFSGQVSQVPLSTPTATPALTAAITLGQFDVEVASDGTLLASAGGAIIRVDPTNGMQTTVATGFGFTGGIFEDAGVIYAVDGFPMAGEEDRVWVLTPVPEPGASSLHALTVALLAMRRHLGSRREKRTGTATRP